MILVIDVSNVCYMSMYSLRGLSTKDIETGVIFGFLNLLLTWSEKFKTNEIVFAVDSRRSKRKRIYPEYKENRSEQPPDILDLIKAMHIQRETILSEVLPAMGFSNIFMQAGYEADDVIASITQNFDEDFTVISSDNDLHQLLDYCTIYSPQTKATLTRDWYLRTHGLEPKSWIDIKAISGCTSDNIKGVPGFGELTARKYLLGFLQENSKAYSNLMSDDGQETYKRNLELVSLPMDGFKPIEDLPYDNLNIDGFMEVCHKYDFRSFINTTKFDKWKIFFNHK